MLSEVSAVPAADLPLGALRDHMRLGTGFADDALQDGIVEAALRASISAIEARTGRALIARAFRLKVSRWRDSSGVALPIGPVERIDGIDLVASDGSALVATSDLIVVEGIGGQMTVAAHSGRLPTIPTGGLAVLHFEAGFGVWEAVPAALRQAVLMLASFLYEDRGALGREAFPPAVAGLIAPWRAWRMTAGGAR